MGKDFIREIKDYSLDELKEIIETQEDLYTKEEMQTIKERYTYLKDSFIKKNIPKEIECPKCDGYNNFEEEYCQFCGVKIEKDKYYNIEYYKEAQVSEPDVEASAKSYFFHYVISFIIPLLGLIIGGIMIADHDEERQSVGKLCIFIGVISVVVSYLLVKNTIKT